MGPLYKLFLFYFLSQLPAFSQDKLLAGTQVSRHLDELDEESLNEQTLAFLNEAVFKNQRAKIEAKTYHPF